MTRFLKVKTAEEVLRIVRGLAPLGHEAVPLASACGRVLAVELTAPEPVPHFARATMDGYAVRARDTFGVSETLPGLMEVGGDVSMGERARVEVKPGVAVAVPTGGMLPAGADAVAMIEYAHPVDGRSVELSRPVAPGENVLAIGEDIAEGEKLFSSGWRLRPQDTGLLAALGITSVQVFKRPRTALLSTGDEIVPPETRPLPVGRIRDINTFTLSGLMEGARGMVGTRGIVEDSLDALADACGRAFGEHDVVVLSGGSSVGARDYTLQILDRLPGAELLVHGVAIRPGKPTILARVGSKLFWGLPGQPVSALMICKSFVLPSLEILEGCREAEDAVPRGTVRAILGARLPSVHGRADYAPVTLRTSPEGITAVPVFGKSAMMSTLARAQGFVVIGTHVEGLDKGSEVTVHLFS